MEVLDCVGDQLHHDKDRELALFAALLLRRLRAIRRSALQDDAKWAGDPTSALELDVTYPLNDVLNEDMPLRYVYEGLDVVLAAVVFTPPACPVEAIASVLLVCTAGHARLRMHPASYRTDGGDGIEESSAAPWSVDRRSPSHQ